MCGRIIAGDLTWSELFAAQRDFLDVKADDQPPIRQSFNVAPSSNYPIIIRTNAGKTGITARWGFVPHWYRKALKDFKISTVMARSEEAHEKPVYRDALRHNRCLIPVKGYYEWQGKLPFRMFIETNQPAFCIAGLFSKVQLPDFDGYTFSVFTEAAAAPLDAIHHRMPVMINTDEYEQWLSGDTEIGNLKRIGADRIKYHKVNQAVGNTRNDYPGLIDPLVDLF